MTIAEMILQLDKIGDKYGYDTDIMVTKIIHDKKKRCVYVSKKKEKKHV